MRKHKARNALAQFREKKGMTQEEFADKIGIGRSRYQNIESGYRNGTFDFWVNLQTAFNISDSEMWELMQSQGARNSETKL